MTFQCNYCLYAATSVDIRSEHALGECFGKLIQHFNLAHKGDSKMLDLMQALNKEMVELKSSIDTISMLTQMTIPIDEAAKNVVADQLNKVVEILTKVNDKYSAIATAKLTQLKDSPPIVVS